jgi:hypothetical protein
MLIKCQNCGEEFEQTRPWSRFCNYYCRMDYHNARYAEYREWKAQQAHEQQQQGSAA